MKEATWLVHVPKGATGTEAAGEVRLVRDGFNLWILLFGPFWFLAKGLFLAALIAFVVIGAAFGARIYFNLTEPFAALATFLPSLFFALEGAVFGQRKLWRRGYEMVDVVRARSAAEAEAKAIARLTEAVASPPRLRGPAFTSGSAAAAGPAATWGTAGQPQILGVFPDSLGAR
jgi:hypothetical protein